MGLGDLRGNSFRENPAGLSQVGFHWNNVRKCWQHPCGHLRERGNQDPREKNGTRFPPGRVPA